VLNAIESLRKYITRYNWTTPFEDLPSAPTAQVLATWANNFKSLRWIPWEAEFLCVDAVEEREAALAPNYMPVVNPTEEVRQMMTDFRSIFPPTEEEMRSSREFRQKYEAVKALYIDCGWPDHFQAAVLKEQESIGIDAHLNEMED
jgi:hypothetical protein